MIHLGCISLIILCICAPISAAENEHELDSRQQHAERRRARGRRHPSNSPRIVGGNPAGAGTYPFLVSLYNRDDPTGFLPVCGTLKKMIFGPNKRLNSPVHQPVIIGGTLITPSVVLTAAHCIADIKSAEIGRYDYTEDEQGVETYTNIERRFHPDYDPDTFDNDYALVKFVDREQPNPFLASLRKTSEIPRDLTIMGWGLTSDGGRQSEILLDANVARFDQTTCISNYLPEPVTENMFCANAQGIDSCQGDSGGPIMISGTNVQVGLVSWGFECGSEVYPGVYARIDQGYDWIEDTVCNILSPDDCTDDNKLPVVDLEGRALEPTCNDREEFLGLGKKLQMRDCDWVGERPDLRCRWYGEDWCPATCEIDRCR